MSPLAEPRLPVTVPSMLPGAGETTLPDHVFAGHGAEALGTILLPNVNLAIWARDTSPAIPGGDALDDIDDVTLTIDVAGGLMPIRTALFAAGYADAPVRTLARDIAGLALRLAGVIDRPRLSIRLEVIETDACKRFHADHVGVRLICTYAGAGTQWLAQDDAARLADGAPIDTLDVHDIPTGHVALFKGRVWAPDRPIVHRSPPIAGTGRNRLVLVIDGAADTAAPRD